jgi:signal transduction histidine kinase
MPVFAPPPRVSPEEPGGPFVRGELAWVVLDLDLTYLRETLLPELIARHLETGDGPEYQVAVVSRFDPPVTIYESSPGAARIAASPDVSIPLFDPQYGALGLRGSGRFGRGGRGSGRPAAYAPGGPPEIGRWEMLARHRAGSLEAVVAQARLRSLAVTAGVLLLLVLTLIALVHFTRSTQRLAALQMNFVAGVSHELRTPLTVIHTAAYNLRGRLAQNPAQVERYGELIQKESGRLKELVEQILRFASANAGRVIHERQPVSVESLIGEALELTKPLVQSAGYTVEKSIAPDLPPVLADARAIGHALQNLIANAVKYGAGQEHWIGISAAASGPVVEIRVADRGPGIPEDEQKHLFDPFFRGRRALDDQIHGTGLGLNLVKKIIDAHGGSIRVESQEGQGAEFILLIPAASGVGGFACQPAPNPAPERAEETPV